MPIAAITMGIFCCSPSGTIASAFTVESMNASAAHILGVSATAVRRRELADAFPGALAETLRSLLSAAAGDCDAQETVEAEINGTSRELAFSVTPVGTLLTVAVTDFSEVAQDRRALRDFAESTGDWFWETGPELRFHPVSGDSQHSGGVAPEAILGISLSALQSAEERDARLSDHLAAIAEHRPFRDMVFALDGPGDRPIWYEISGKPYYSLEGQWRGYRGLGRDVTARILAAESTRQIALLVAATDDAIFSYDIDGNIQSWNDSAARLYGVPAAEILGRHRSTLLTDQTAIADMDRIHERVLAGETMRTGNLERHRPDGQSFWVFLTFSPVFDARGHIIGAVAIGRDVSDRVEAEAKRHQDAEQLRLMADAVPAMIAYCSSDLIYTFANKTVTHWYDCKLSDFVGRGMQDLLPVESYRRARPAAERALQGETVTFSAERRFPDGVTRGVSTTYVPDRDANGSVRGFFVLTVDLSERIAAEQHIREKQEQLDLIANAVPAAISHLDKNLIFTFVNATTVKWYGSENHPLLGERYGDPLPPVLAEYNLGMARRALAGETIEFERTGMFEDGVERSISVVMTPDRRPDGRIEGVIVLATDVTRARAAEAEVDEKRAQLDLIANALPVAIGHLDRDLRFRFANRTAMQWYSTEQYPQVGEKYGDSFPTEIAAKVVPLAERALAGERIDFETTRTFVDGVHRTINVVMTPDQRDDGTIEGVFLLAMDTTQLKTAEATIREKEAQLSLIADSVPIGIAQTDRNLRLTFINETGQRWYGGPDKPLVGLRFDDFLPAELLSRVKAQTVRALAGESVNFETTRMFADGIERTVNVAITPDWRDDGDVVGLFLSVTDISQLKQAEAKASASAQQMRLITNAVPALIAYCDRDYRYLFANNLASTYYDRPIEDIIGKRAEELIGEAAVQQLMPHVERAFGGEQVEFEGARTFSDGKFRHFQTTYVPDRDETGEVRGIFLLLVDITRRKLAEKRLEASAQQIKLMMDAVPAMIAYVDDEERYSAVNKTFADWLELPESELLGKTPRETWGEEAYGAMRQYIRRAMAGERVHYEGERAFPGGRRRTLDITLIPDRRDDGSIAGQFYLAIDITERKETEVRLQLQAMTDPLTGVSNRRSFFETGRGEILRAQRYGRPLSIVLADLDHFKQVNDTYGHEAGDHVLVEFAKLCAEAVRGSVDRVGRLGGEEFALLLPETDAAGAMLVAERLRELCNDKSFAIPDQSLHVTCSLGVAQCYPNDSGLKAGIARADTALYAAKSEGRNRVCLAEDVAVPLERPVGRGSIG